MELRDPIDDGEADTHTLIFLIAPLIDPVEFFLHEVELALGNTMPIIGEGQDILFFTFLELRREPRAIPRILDEIREDIMQYLRIHIFIHTDHGISGEIEFDLLSLFLELWLISSDNTERELFE